MEESVKRCLHLSLAVLMIGGQFLTLAVEEGLVLRDATPIRLRLGRNLSSADAKVGETADFEVLDDLKIDDLLVIARGSTAIATVTQAQSKRRMARGGKLDVNIDYVRLADGDKAALRAVKEMKGGGHTGAMTGGMVATAIVFFPAAPLFLFMHGKDVTIPKGTEITAYVNGDIKLQREKFRDVASGSGAAARVSTIESSTPTVALLKPGSLTITSEPAGADIEINGKFVGNTPSTLEIQPGSANIAVQKNGFRTWTRRMEISGGSSISLRAELERETGNVVVVQPAK
jgi:hypothetical protein